MLCQDCGPHRNTPLHGSCEQPETLANPQNTAVYVAALFFGAPPFF